MDRSSVKSSNIVSVGYDAETKTLEIEFSSGGIYSYSGVPAAVYTGLMNSSSKGSYFANNIRGKFQSEKL